MTKQRQIQKLAFLIHPGFFGAAEQLDNYRDYFDWKKKDRVYHSDHQEIVFYQTLFNEYRKHAEKLSPRDILVVLSYQGRQEMRDLRQDQNTYPKDLPVYTRLCQQLKKKLGDRCVVLTMNAIPGEDDIGDEGLQSLEGPTQFLDTLRRILAARGYTFDRDTVTEAFGESLGYCVSTYADLLNRAGEFAEPTTIDPNLTDMDDPTLPRRDELPDIQADDAHRRVRYLPPRSRK